MYSIRKWMFKPKRSDNSNLAQFFYADEELNLVAAELDSFDGRKDPERCSMLVNQLRLCQDKVLVIVDKIIHELLPAHQQANRDFRVKFPDDVLQESLAGQLWFGAECLAAGSSIMNREVESASMRPLAKALTRHLDLLRSILRDQCLRDITIYSSKIKEALRVFDRLFAEFELSYVSAMVPVKTMKEYDMLQEVIVLFSETTIRALKLNLLTQDMIDDYDPAIMFTIPRLAIVCGLLIYPEGPLNPDMDPVNMSEMFRPFQTLLYKIRELLWTLSREELWMLEKSLCSSEEPGLYRELENLQLNVDSALYPNDYPEAFGLPSDLAEEIMTDANSNKTLKKKKEKCKSKTSKLASSVSDEEYACGMMMTNSPSNMTVVANPDFLADPSSAEKTAQYDSDSCVPSDKNQSPEGRENTAETEENVDVSSLGEGCSTNNPADQAVLDPLINPTVAAISAQLVGDNLRTLRHSQSWPQQDPMMRRGQLTGQHSLGGATAAGDEYAENAAAGPSCEHEPSQRARQEFSFHLPMNTEAFTGVAIENDNVPKITVDEATDRQAVYVVSNTEHQSPERQISFVTDALNELFRTDPSFQENLSFISPRKDTDKDPCCLCKRRSSTEGSCSNSDTQTSKVSAETNSKPITASKPGETFEQKENRENVEKSATEENQPAILPISESLTANTSYFPDHMTVTGDLEAPPASPTCNDHMTVTGDLEAPPAPPTCNVTDCESDTCTDSHVSPSCSCLCHANCDNKDQFSESSLEEALDKESTLNKQARNSSERDHRRSSLRVPPRVQRMRSYPEPNSMSKCSSCNSSKKHSPSSSMDYDWDRESYTSSDASSYCSDYHDDEEIAMAIQAAELAARKDARSRFKSSADLIHRLFVCISGVADQLQTNYASDLRHLLKCVFECNATDIYGHPDGDTVVNTEEPSGGSEEQKDIETAELPQSSSNTNQIAEISDNEPAESTPSSVTEDSSVEQQASSDNRNRSLEGEPPQWVPDEESPHCVSCKVVFTFVRRRHHCRNCGKVFCGRCSSNAVPLPHYGHAKPVRVCNHCFMFQVIPFTVEG